ncbi:hypothetical protein ANN_13201 [Periplaneta americana]|uniref:Uncharacterized protein n=1 Tax=Periplaneta americana TaxID=6978 RepID=A0ABQ8TM86_PERAM|nr:hypothetical protein ANN_13201 [Periplaneta americana]
MSHQTPQHIIWDRLRKIRGINRNTYISAICQPNSNILVTNPQDIANTLADTFSKISSDCSYEQDFLHIKNNAPELDPNEMNCNTDQSFNDILTLREVQDTLSHSKNNSPGPDNIPYEFLKQLPPDGVLYLYEVYNYIWSKQVFPDQWRNVIIIPILKPDKNRSAPENYRPIALTCTMCKLLEKIINKRLRWTLEQRNFFTTSQNGFRQFHSTIDSLITLESEILNAFLNKQHLLAVNLDIHEAYDMVWRQYVVKVLIKNQITGNMIRFIHNFLQNRTIQVKVNGTLSKKVIINNDVPQGSVISVTLFLVAINNITSHVSLPAKTCLFADDLTIFCTGKNLTTTQDIIQSSVKGIENWAKETGFKFSANKSECILFSKRNTPHAQPQLYLNNNKLPIVNTIKFLGIIFDRKLTWAPHLAALKEECLRRISFLKTLAARNWGADYKVLMCTYRILIRSKLDYGCIVYNSAKSSSLQKLNVIQNSALRIALGAFRTSPIANLQIEADELPLDIRRKQLSISYALKIAASSRSNMHSYIFSEHHDKQQIHSAPFSSRLKQYFNEMNMSIPSISQRNKNTAHPPWRIMLPEINLDLTYHIKTETNNITYQQFCREQWDQYRNYRHIYTDGSQTNQGCGCAVVYPDHTMLYTLPSLYSVFTCELYAIKKALEYILETETDKSYLLHTDSQSSLQALQDIFSTNALIQEIHQLLTDLMKQGRKITLIWIPSHQGIPGNETVDAAAKEATRLPLHFFTSIPHTDAIKYITRKLHNHWQTSWTESSSSKLHEIVQHCRMKYPLQNFKRQDQGNIGGVRRLIVWTIVTSPGGAGSSKKSTDEARSVRTVTAATPPNVRGIIKAAITHPTVQAAITHSTIQTFAPSDFHLFGPMKKFLGGQRFGSDEEVKSAVRRWLCAQKTEFYEQGVLKSVTIGEICRETWFQCRRIRHERQHINLTRRELFTVRSSFKEKYDYLRERIRIITDSPATSSDELKTVLKHVPEHNGVIDNEAKSMKLATGIVTIHYMPERCVQVMGITDDVERKKVRVFENKVLRKIFGAKRDEVPGEWRKLHNIELHALYSSPDMIRNIKSRRLRWAGHVARMGESRNAYRVIVGRPEGKRPLGRPRRRWEDNIKMDLREVGHDDRDWINLAQDRDRLRAYVRAAMKPVIRLMIRAAFVDLMLIGGPSSQGPADEVTSFTDEPELRAWGPKPLESTSTSETLTIRDITPAYFCYYR